MRRPLQWLLQIALTLLAAGFLSACGGGGGDPGTPANSTPVARAGGSLTGMVATSIALDGSGSTDADGDAITYAWTIASAPAGSTAALTHATTARPGLVPDREGAYTVSLTVSDGKISSAASTVSVTATSLVAEVLLDKPEPLVEQVKLALTAGIALPVTWYVDLNLLGDGSTAANSLTWDSATASNGQHLITARIKTGASSFLEVKRTVQVGNSTLRITNGAPTITPGNIELYSTVLSGYTVTKVVAALDGVDQVTLTSPNFGSSGYHFNINSAGAASGTHTVTIKATDSSGSTRQATVSVEISNAPVVVLQSPTPPDNGFVSGTLQVKGTVTSDKQGVVKTTVSLNNVAFINTTAASFDGSYDVSALPPNFYTLKVSSTDATGQLREVTRSVFVTSSAALAYAPAFVLPAGAMGQLLAVGEGDNLIYRGVSDYDATVPVARVRNLVTGVDKALTGTDEMYSFSNETPRGWGMADGRVYVTAKSMTCAYTNATCVYRFAPDGTYANLSSENPFSVAGLQGATAAHDGYVLWSSASGLVLYDALPSEIVAGTYTQVFGLPASQSFISYDFAVVNGVVNVVYSARTGASTTEVYRWKAGDPAPTLLGAGAAWDFGQQIDTERMAWRHSATAQQANRPASLLSQSVGGGTTTTTLSTNANAFLLRDGLLAWTEGDPALDWDLSSSRATVLKVSKAGITSTVSNGPAVQLLAVGGGHVAYVSQGKIYTWNAATGQATLRSETVPAPEPVLILNGALVFRVGQLVYRVPLN